MIRMVKLTYNKWAGWINRHDFKKILIRENSVDVLDTSNQLKTIDIKYSGKMKYGMQIRVKGVTK